MSWMNDKSQKKTASRKYRVVLWWKLHVDTGEPLDVPPKDHETSYFKVEGKKRPAIVWRVGKTHSLLVLLTETLSPHVMKLGKLEGAKVLSYFDPRRIERYPNKLKVHELPIELSNEHRQFFLEEIERFSMTSQTIEQKNNRS